MVSRSTLSAAMTWTAVVAGFALVSHGAILGSQTLTVDLTDLQKAKAEATWSPPDKLSITDEGLGWDGDAASSYDGWIRTRPVGVGLSWRPTYSVSIRVTIQPAPSRITLPNGQKMTPYPGNVFVRYSPDLEHWSSWQVLERAEASSDDERSAGRRFNDKVEVPRCDRDEYSRLLSEFSKLDVPWKSDEDAAVRWILKRDPDFFAKTIPFIGYVQFLYEGSFRGGQRLKSFEADVSYGVGGKHFAPEDNSVYEDRDSRPWGFKTKEKRDTDKDLLRKPKVPFSGITDLKLQASLSADTVAVGGNVSVTVKLVNTGKKDVMLSRNDLRVWLSFTDLQDAPITELPFMDTICAPGKSSRIVVAGGESEVIRVFGAQVKKGSWKGFGTSGSYEGVGIVLQRDAGASCYPLKNVPGEYFLRGHLRSKVSGPDAGPAVEIESGKVRMSVLF